MQDKTILYPLVLEEAKNLRKKITKEEREQLNLENLDPRHTRSCIYGQIGGDCDSWRAVELIKSCCKRVYTPNKSKIETLANATVNGSPKNKERSNFWSPIEVMIVQRGQKRNTKNLVAYLKKEKEELILK